MDESYIREMAQRELEALSRRAFLHRMGGTAVLLTGSGSFLAACGSSGATKETSDTGKVGGALNFLGVDGEDGKAVAQPFLTKQKVKLKAAYAPDNDTMLTKLRTGGTRNFDVLTISKDYAYKEIELGYVRKLDRDRLDNFDGLFEGFQTAPWVRPERQGLRGSAHVGLGADRLRPRQVVVAPAELHGLRRQEVRRRTHHDRRALREPVADVEVAEVRAGRQEQPDHADRSSIRSATRGSPSRRT